MQILRGQEWGAIGTSQWDIQDADVICRQLGFLIAESATLGDNFSSTHPAPPIHIDAVECTGDEWSLSSCLYTLVSDQGEELTGRPRAGVKCAGELDMLINIASFPVALFWHCTGCAGKLGMRLSIP